RHFCAILRAGHSDCSPLVNVVFSTPFYHRANHYGFLLSVQLDFTINRKKISEEIYLFVSINFLCVYVLPEPGNRIVKTGILFKSVFDLMLAEQFLANLRLCFLKKYIPHF
ncbi:hypothetical protein, partial [Ruthenibacterium lactatiformans]|uniref:hypothetical protein n=2 Tax=Ruthenibacterium lactatiformans TaxID=1550024 RepID=UPI003AAAC56A